MTVGTRPRGGALGLLVLGLHLALGLALHQLLRPPARGPAATGPVHVWISLREDPPAARPPRPTATGPARRPAAQPQPASPQRPAPGPAEPQAITLPAAPPPTPSVADPGPAAAASPPPAAPAPLNLALPARSASAPPPSGWARQDPRVHDAPLDGEQRMARTLGTDTTLHRVARGDGFELRRGNDCVQVQPARAGQIFMPDGGSRPPSQVGKC